MKMPELQVKSLVMAWEAVASEAHVSVPVAPSDPEQFTLFVKKYD